MEEILKTAADLPVSALTGDEIVCVAPGATLLEVADAMAGAAVGLVVVGDQAEPSGVVSERDLVAALAARNSMDATTAADIAHTTIVWCDATASVAEVAEQMMEEWVRHILVEEGGRTVGIVSARDLLGVYASEGEG